MSTGLIMSVPIRSSITIAESSSQVNVFDINLVEVENS